MPIACRGDNLSLFAIAGINNEPGNAGGELRSVSQVPTRVVSRWLAATAGVAAIVVLISSARAQVVTTINGQPITEQNIQERARLDDLGGRRAPDRQAIIDELSKEIEDISQARRHGIAPSEAEVNRSLKGIAERIGIDSQELTELLNKHGASEATLKQRLRGEMARVNLERGGFDAQSR